MEEKEWLCFEKSGKVSDYLAYLPEQLGQIFRIRGQRL